ncbi:hypothetical protein D3C75_455370 [compost metagenome]
MNDSIADKLDDLYILQKKRYLIQYPKQYITFQAGQVTKQGKKQLPLSTWQIDKHLSGEMTVGTFSGRYKTKFITFDVDFEDNLEMANWIVYVLSNYLEQMGIPEHYISFSGNKGYHIDIFISDLILIEVAHQFYLHVLIETELIKYKANIEFRPTAGQGVKLPLGIHRKTNQYCGFCEVGNGLLVMDKIDSEHYLMGVKKIQRHTIMNLVGQYSDDDIDVETFIQTEDALAQYKPLPIYYQSEDYTIDKAQSLLKNGLKTKGSRHKALFTIALYFKYSGLNAVQMEAELRAWMDWQDPNTYSTKLELCYKDIEQIVKDVIERGYNLTPGNKDLSITYDEIKEIIHKCPEKNQKLLTYALLIHSKRFATKQGIFFMSYSHMAEATGLGVATVNRQIEKLACLKIVEIVERKRQGKGKMKLPNKYRIRLNCVSNNEKDTFKTEDYRSFSQCVQYFFTKDELKMMLPRRQYQSLIS